jgi:hypothetical protein
MRAERIEQKQMAVIARSEAMRQSRLSQKRKLDCFAALAMTAERSVSTLKQQYFD